MINHQQAIPAPLTPFQIAARDFAFATTAMENEDVKQPLSDDKVRAAWDRAYKILADGK